MFSNFLERALPILLASAGELNMHTANCLINLGVCYGPLGLWQQKRYEYTYKPIRAYP